MDIIRQGEINSIDVKNGETRVIFLTGIMKYHLAIYDRSHELTDILKDRKISAIREFLLPHSKKIRKVSIDMFMKFRNTVSTFLPEADIVADKYHVIRQVTG